MINAGFDLDSGNNIIKNVHADMMAYAKLLLSITDLPTRFEKNAKLAEWDKDRFHEPGAKGYTDYPKLN